MIKETHDRVGQGTTPVTPVDDMGKIKGWKIIRGTLRTNDRRGAATADAR